MSKVVTTILSTLAVIIVLVIIVVFTANLRFNQMVKKDVENLFNNVKNKREVIENTDLEELPPPVQKWLERSNVIGKEKIVAVRTKQKAQMRMGQDKSWMPTDVEQYFTVDEPGFIWKARIKAAPFLHIMGRDKYYEGKGNMLIKILSLITVADAAGEEIDQGTLVRYLAETVWFPTAALSNYIEWKQTGQDSAEATMSYKGTTASGVFTFNEKGDVVDFTAQRYREVNRQYSLETWSIRMEDYKEFDGIRIPAKGEVIWKLDKGDFNWYQFEVTQMEYNKPDVF